MRSAAKLIVPTVAVSLLLAACGSSSSSTTNTTTASSASPAAQTTSSSAALVKTGSTSLGTILVNGSGMTLYHLSGEKSGKFICTSSGCTAVWHPLTASAGATPTGQVGSLGVVKRPDGTTQVTYKGEPLYTFASDQQAGETKGQGFKDVGTWTVITTTGSAPASSSAPATTSTQSETSSGGGGGGAYGY
jgi:predicted lipoprotein with Yx(FWY)xxD motif